MPPDARLFQLIAGKWVAMALATAAKLRVADDLAGGSLTAADLAARKGVDADALNRVLRALASVGVFATDAAGRYSLTELGQLLRTGVPGSLRAVADYCGADWSWRSWGDLPETVRTGATAIDRVFGVPVFEYLRDHPAEAAVFNEGMTGFSTAAAPLVAKAGVGWGNFDRIVDVGGGHGALLLAILQEHPGPEGILFDAPQVVAGATEVNGAVGKKWNCRTEGGDFFQRVPAGDGYVLKNVIHDWADAPATVILCNCRTAALPDAKLVLVELVIPPGDEPHPAKLLDLEMLAVAGGRERTEAEYAALLAGAGWKLTRVIPTRSPFSLLVADAV